MINRVLEDKGIVIYHHNVMPKKENNQPDTFLFRQNSKQFVLRIHVQYKTNVLLKIEKGDKDFKVSENNLHHAIFENQLRLPPSLSQINLEMIDWY